MREQRSLGTGLGLVLGLLSFAAFASPRSKLVDVAPHVRLHVLEDGNPSTRPTLVLIPGWRLTANIWSHQIQAFSRDRRVIAIDPRSQGDSTKTDEGDTPEQRARDYHALLNALHAGAVVLVGWSQGVQDVAAYIEQFGTDGVDAVVLVDSTISKGAANVPNMVPFAVQQLRLLPLMSDSPREYTEGMMRAIISKPLSDSDLSKLVSDALKTPTATGEAMLIADLFGRDRSAALPKFTVPTLIIASERSAELAQQADLAKQLPNARIVVMAQAAHAVFVDQPDRFETVVRNFLEHRSAS
ncbi:MAG TPA: alpha/beta hydrolase [Xanthobacteraceae bacterium]|jgi:microsomal epoxide hydrolase